MGGEGGEYIPLIFIEIQAFSLSLFSKRLIASISGNELLSSAEIIHCQVAVVAAAIAVDALGTVHKGLQARDCDNRTFFLPPFPTFLLGPESGAVGSHQACHTWPSYVLACLLLEGTKNSVIKESSSLDHYVVSKKGGIGSSDDLIEGITHYAYGKACRYVLHSCSILLGFLYQGIHEYCTS